MASDTGSGALDIVNKRIQELSMHVARLGDDIERLGGKTAKAAGVQVASLKRYESSLKVAQVQQRQLIKGQNDLRRSTGYLGTSIAYLASDMGFLAQNPRMGLLAIGNNLSQVAIGMQAAAEKAGSLGKAMKAAFITQGWMIALQLGISLLTQLPVIMKKLKFGVKGLGDELQKSIIDKMRGANGAVGKIRMWANILNTATEGTDQHTIALQNLKKLGYDPAIMSLEKFIKLKQSSALLDAFTSITSSKIAEKMGEIYAKEQDLEKAIKAEETARENALSASDPESAGFYSGDITIQKDKQTKIKKEIEKLNNDIIEINRFGATKIKSIIDESPDIWKVLFPNLTKDKDIQTISERYDNMIALFGKKGRELIEKRREIALAGAKTQDDKDSINAYFDLLVGQFDQKKAMESYNKWMQWQDKLKEKLEVSNKWFEKFKEEKSINDQEKEDLARLEIDNALLKFKDYEERKTAIQKYYSKKRQDIDKAENQAKIGQLQTTIQHLGNFMNNAAQLGEENKGLAKAAVITNAAAASIGIWQSYHDLASPLKGPLATAGAVLAQASLVASTVSALRNINNADSGNTSGGSGGPNFNIIGQNQNSALQATIQEQTGVIQDQDKESKVVLVTSELEKKQKDKEVITKTTNI